MSPADYRHQAEAFEAEYRVWCEREAALAGNVSHYLRNRDEDSAAATEQRRKEAQDAANKYWNWASEARKAARDLEERRRFFSAAAGIVDRSAA